MRLIHTSPPIYFIENKDTLFPDPHHSDDEGLIAIGGNFSSNRLLQAYKQGIFPWFIDDNNLIHWFSPNPRMVLYPDKFHVSHSLKKRLSSHPYHITVNECFDNVMYHCQHSRKNSWITSYYIEAYTHLFRQDYALSIEVWDNETLIGGLYGVKIGQLFCGESMFSYKRDSSKIAFHFLCHHALELNIMLIDCQVPNPHLASLGATEMSRKEFLETISRLIN